MLSCFPEDQFVEDQYKEECPKPPPTCPNNCEVMEAHKKECPLEIIQCEYHNDVGCEVNMTCKDMERQGKAKIKDYLKQRYLHISSLRMKKEKT